jgi:hypothetical protein
MEGHELLMHGCFGRPSGFHSECWVTAWCVWQARPLLYELGKMVQGADLEGVILNKKDGSIFRILNHTAAQMRRSGPTLARSCLNLLFAFGAKFANTVKQARIVHHH